MRAGLWLIGLFALAVAVTLAARLDDGYVLIVYPPWRVEMSFLLALVLATLLFLLGYVVVRLLRVALRLPGEVRSWRERRHRDAADRALHEAMAAFLAGHHDGALKQAEQAATSHNPQLAALIGAQAARALGQTETARRLLAAAEGKKGEVETARLVLEAQLRQPD